MRLINFPWYPGLQLSFILSPKGYHVTVLSLLVFKGQYVVQIVNLSPSTLKWFLLLMRFCDMSCGHSVSVYSGRRGLGLTFRNVSFLQAKKSLLQKYPVAKNDVHLLPNFSLQNKRLLILIDSGVFKNYDKT